MEFYRFTHPFSFLTCLSFFILSFCSGIAAQAVQSNDFFEGRKSIQGTVATPAGDRPLEIAVSQSWELLSQTQLCCGKTITLPLYGKSAALDENTQKEIIEQIGRHFPDKGLLSESKPSVVVQYLNESDLRWNGKEDLPHPEELLQWKEEDLNIKIAPLASLTEELKSFQAPPCNCMNLTRYQLRTDYTFSGGDLAKEVLVTQYSQIYHSAQQIISNNCANDEICKILNRGFKAVLINFPKDIIEPNEEVRYTPKGTGRTTGHIINLEVFNRSVESVFLQIEPMYIPSNGQFQSYVVTNKQVVEIKPGQNKDIPLMGVCADIRKPPVPSGENAFSDILSWIPMSEAGPVLEPAMIYSPSAQAFISRPIDQLIYDAQAGTMVPKTGLIPSSEAPAITYPGTNVPFPVKIKLDRDYQQVARMIIKAVLLIDSTYAVEARKGTIQTPFSSQSARQSEAVRQQLTWLYVAAMTDEPYKKEDFKQQIIKQYESNTGRSFELASPSTKGNIEKGVDQFWDAFEVVGIEAKII